MPRHQPSPRSHRLLARCANSFSTLTILFALAVATPLWAGDQQPEPPPSPEQMWRIIQEQQALIRDLSARLTAQEKRSATAEQRLGEVQSQAAVVEAKVAATDTRLEATASFVETLGPSAKPGAGQGWYERTHLGGYGELHASFGDAQTVDFHRWVLLLSHDFNDRIRLASELELEHSIAGEGKKGEIELEQAYIEFDLAENTQARAGLFILPLGLLNETHEPGTYYGVERNRVESEIIPTSWWEAGASLSHRFPGGISVDAALHSGLMVPTTGSNAFRIRSGRQKASEASAADGAATVRVNYTGLPGLTLGAAVQVQSDIAQGRLAEKIGATLVEAHADWRWRGFGLRALWAQWSLNGLAPRATGAQTKAGWYIEPSYRFETGVGALGFFVRHSRNDNNAGDAADSAIESTTFGTNFWPHERVVLKADYELLQPPAPAEDDAILNLGVGYQF